MSKPEDLEKKKEAFIAWLKSDEGKAHHEECAKAVREGDWGRLTELVREREEVNQSVRDNDKALDPDARQ